MEHEYTKYMSETTKRKTFDNLSVSCVMHSPTQSTVMSMLVPIVLD